MNRRHFLALAAAPLAADATVKVPKFIGMHLVRATGNIRALGFTLGPVRRVSSTRPQDVVVDQAPAPFTRVARGAEVTLFVSEGVDRKPKKEPER